MPRGQAAKDALSLLGIDVAEIQRRAGETFGPGAFMYPRAHYSGRARMVLQSSFRQARELGKQQAGTEHLLLGILETRGSASRVLAALGVDTRALGDLVRGHR